MLVLGVLYISMVRLELFYTLLTLCYVTYLFIRYRYLSITSFAFQILLPTFACIYIFFNTEIYNFLSVLEFTLGGIAGNIVDSSYDIRFMEELPFLLYKLSENPFFGSGFGNLIMEEQKMIGLYAFVDVPFFGSLAAYGVIGMFVYYLKVIYLISLKPKVIILEKSTETFLLLLSIWVYFLGSILFRLYHISFELVFDYRQVEFGFFVGLFMALHRINDGLEISKSKINLR